MAQDENVYRAYLDRRSPRDLPPLRTTFAAPPTPKGRRQRPVEPPVKPTAHRPSAPEAAPAPQPKMERRQSRMSLFNLFSKPKVEKLRGYTEDGMPEATLSPSPNRQKQTPAAYTVPPALNIQAPPKAISTLIGPSRVAQQIPPRESSRRALSHRVSQSDLSRQPSPSVWEPPALFEAFPQSIKHAFLPALNYSADSILRAQKSKRNSLLQNFRDSKIDLTLEDSENAYSKVSTDRSSKRFSSQSLNGPGWTRKIFILISSGVLLQYAADGSPERQPEKVLQLEKDSAAFASDAIPGRHWVLQVSQAANGEGNSVPAKSRSLLSRLKVQSSAARKLTGNMLLVMESPEDMNSWMIAIRHEIEVMGGKKSRPDAYLEQRLEEPPIEHDVREYSNHRYTPHRYAAKAPATMSPIQDTPSSPAIITSEWDKNRLGAEIKKSNDEMVQPNVAEGEYLKSPRHSIQRPPSDRASTTTYLSSGEQQLNQLRNGSRESNLSSNTVATSRASSPESQVPHPPKPAEQEPRRGSVTGKIAYSSPPMSSNSWRRSMQTLPKTDEYSIFPKESSPRGKRVSTRSDGSTTTLGPPSSIPSGSPPRFRRTSLSATQPEVTPRTQEDDVSPTDTSRSSRSVKSSPNLKRISITPEIPEIPSPDEVVPKPSLIRPLHSVNALNQESSRRTSDPKVPRRNSAVPMRLPIRSSLPALDTGVPAKPVMPTPGPTFLTTPSPATPTPTVAAPVLAAVPKQAEPSSLKRPTSVQVRANHAPFLSTVRPTRASASENSPPSDRLPPYNPRSSSLFAPVTVSSSMPGLASARSFTDLGINNRSSSSSNSSSSILAPPPRNTGSRYFSDSSARFPVQISQNPVNRAGQRGLAARASMPYLNRDSGIGLPPPSAPPPEVPLPRVPT